MRDETNLAERNPIRLRVQRREPCLSCGLEGRKFPLDRLELHNGLGAAGFHRLFQALAPAQQLHLPLPEADAHQPPPLRHVGQQPVVVLLDRAHAFNLTQIAARVFGQHPRHARCREGAGCRRLQWAQQQQMLDRTRRDLARCHLLQRDQTTLAQAPPGAARTWTVAKWNNQSSAEVGSTNTPPHKASGPKRSAMVRVSASNTGSPG